jgi:hypothetical protein
MKIKPLEAEVFVKGVSIKKGLVTRLTTLGAYVYDPKEPKKETPDGAEWFPYESPNGIKTSVFAGQ